MIDPVTPRSGLIRVLPAMHVELASRLTGQVHSFSDYATAKLAAYKLNRYGKIE